MVRCERVLYRGTRGFPGGDTLARLLARERGIRNNRGLSPFDEEEILSWADAWFANGPVAGRESPGRSSGHRVRRGWLLRWPCQLERAAYPGGSSLARLLAERRGVRNRNHPPPLAVAEILAWADAHHDRTGEWPGVKTGPVVESPDENWRAISSALGTVRGACPAGRRSRSFLLESGAWRTGAIGVVQGLSGTASRS